MSEQSSQNTKRLSELRTAWAKVVGCQECARKRRKAIVKLQSFFRGQPHVAVMFSGGLDSTYVAWYLKEIGHKVQLYHVRWLYDTNDTNAQELAKATAIAEKLQLPLHILGTMRVDKAHTGNVMRVPTIGAMMICHRHLRFDKLATGMAPSISERDHGWHSVLQGLADRCMPKLEIIHPRDGTLRSEITQLIPADLRAMVYSRVVKGDDE